MEATLESFFPIEEREWLPRAARQCLNDVSGLAMQSVENESMSSRTGAAVTLVKRDGRCGNGSYSSHTR
jgi:hypothetical protein